MKQVLHITFFQIARICFLALLPILMGCGDQNDFPTEGNLQLSDKEIELAVDGWKSMQESRAAIFENSDDIKSESVGGGSFTLYAYMQETGKTFIGGARVLYFVPMGGTTGTWEFYSHPNIIQYYWPQAGSVDFFAYMPWKNSGKRNSLRNIAYSETSGAGTISFECEMQSTTADGVDGTDDLEDSQGQETIIAYTTGKSKADKSVNMHFVHPFSAVYFKLKQAHRNLKINWFRFDNVYLNGTSSMNSSTDGSSVVAWTPKGTPGTFTIPVAKTIPDDINFGGDIGGPYMVMPQVFDHKATPANPDDDVMLTVNYTWDDGLDTDVTNDTKQFSRSITTTGVTEWIAGKKYTYILDLGDNNEEILFKVIVEPWDVEGYDHIIDVQ